MRALLLSVSLLVITLPARAGAQHQPALHQPELNISVDSGRKVVTIEAGPFSIPAGQHSDIPGGQAQPTRDHHDASHSRTPFLTFDWPTDGWLRGVKLRITDSDGNALPRELIHHINLVNLNRRQLFYPAAERTVALGQETEDIHLPATVGIPISSGTSMGVVLAWHNTSQTAHEGVTVTLDVEWLPHNTAPRPLSVMPVYLDVRYPIGQPVDFDLPAGRQEFSADFTMPIDGRVIAAGGHLHDYGLGLELTEVRDDGERSLIELGTTRDSAGRVSAVERQYPGIRGRGIRLSEGRTYRMKGRYDNTSGELLHKGAMVHLILLFAPEEPTDWPGVDTTEKDFNADLAWLHGQQ